MSLEPFICRFCGITLDSFDRMKLHVDRHMIKYAKAHGARYECKYCHRYFASNNILQIHSRTHTKIYQCEMCQKYISSKCNLRRHFRTPKKNLMSVNIARDGLHNMALTKITSELTPKKNPMSVRFVRNSFHDVGMSNYTS